jgi:hypothetical protein
MLEIPTTLFNLFIDNFKSKSLYHRRLAMSIRQYLLSQRLIQHFLLFYFIVYLIFYLMVAKGSIDVIHIASPVSWASFAQS